MDIHSIYAFFEGKFRQHRMAIFTRQLTVNERTSILDLGGDAPTWESHALERRVTLLNLDPRSLRGHEAAVVASALTVPFTDRAFDVVFSNSVIEHLGTAQRQQDFAAEVRRLCKTGYFVQTPNKWFPIEPHYLAPFVQFVPLSIRPHVIRWATPRGWLGKPSRERCAELCHEIRLLDAREMSQLFPEARIVRERFFGLTKSVIAIWQLTESGQPIQVRQ